MNDSILSSSFINFKNYIIYFDWLLNNITPLPGYLRTIDKHSNSFFRIRFERVSSFVTSDLNSSSRGSFISY